MLRTLIWVTWMLFYLLARLPQHRKAVRLRREGRLEEHKALVNGAVNRWTGKLLRNIGVNLTVEGRENLPKDGQTVMFVSNHQSYIDIPVLLNGLDQPHALLAKKELGKVPMLRGWMDELGCIYVDRNDTRASMAVLRQGEEMLKNGQSLIVCPEGTRSKSDALGEFKPGAVRMAVKAGVPVVPVAIDGTWRVLEGSGYRLTRADVRLVILPAVETEGLSRPEQKELTGRLEAMIRAAKDDRAPKA